MTEMPDNILYLPEYQVLGCKSTDDEMPFQVEAPDPIACEECGVQGEFVRFGKRDVPYRDLPIHGKRVTVWVEPDDINVLLAGVAAGDGLVFLPSSLTALRRCGVAALRRCGVAAWPTVDSQPTSSLVSRSP
ncbi:zinc-finger of transposase IS204/IS1001/IS1096/IS1165 [Rhodospira trueperi]|uniref:Zinc-finger of transposase IS204/IS1001/IS1096/IS1165 n=1 Tax=Rhodospira trueperi TaxID=69960 RepID=A0A1G7DCL4_9PROT|nr:zinc-finger of transposase IS204/IS1001/IS1096/IS1165 [Rhodospira trueperi]